MNINDDINFDQNQNIQYAKAKTKTTRKKLINA